MIINKFNIISEGYCYAKTFVITDNFNYDLTSIDPKLEIERFLDAINLANKDLENQEAPYFTIQRLILNDTLLKNTVINKIEDLKLSAEAAIKKTILEFKNNLLNSTSRYLQERIYDLEDMSQRLINILTKNHYSFPKEDFILVVDELLPSILLENASHIKGIITKVAGFMSHGAILARNLEIPYITTNINIPNNTYIIMDTRYKHLILEPKEEDIIKLKNKECNNILSFSHNGYGLYANIFDNEELDKVNKYQFDGVGLYRTEFIFMHNNRPLTTQEQQKIYTSAVKTLGPKDICFRTFDIGDDKQIPYFKTYKKGFLNYVNNRDMFEDQIKALISSNLYGKMKIMFPMIENKEEFNFLKSWVLFIKKELNNTTPLKIGMMLETKEALLHIEDFKDADFFSIGTNDLSVQLYNINREKAKDIPLKLIIDLQKRLAHVVKFCEENNIELSMCGELAGIPKATQLFLKIGIKNFSVSPSSFKNLNQSLYNYLKDKE